MHYKNFLLPLYTVSVTIRKEVKITVEVIDNNYMMEICGCVYNGVTAEVVIR